jgi:hypothetical protein
MDIIRLLQVEGTQLTNQIRFNIIKAGESATRETESSLRIEIKQQGAKTKMQLFGRPFFMTVQTGRKPTPGKKPSREMIANITRWTEARGIDLDAVWGIATKIQNKGTELWRKGGRTDIVDPAVEEFNNNVQDALLKAGADDLVLKIKQMKW